jgi:Arc/MetJ family transcription regulator
VAKHLVDIDEDALNAARAELGTQTIRDTVNQALVLAAGERARDVKRSMDVLARMDFADREDAWR